jgi:hypothetical protein
LERIEERSSGHPSFESLCTHMPALTAALSSVPSVELLRLVDLIVEEQSQLQEDEKGGSHADGSSGMFLSVLGA